MNKTFLATVLIATAVYSNVFAADGATGQTPSSPRAEQDTVSALRAAVAPEESDSDGSGTQTSSPQVPSSSVPMAPLTAAQVLVGIDASLTPKELEDGVAAETPEQKAIREISKRLDYVDQRSVTAARISVVACTVAGCLVAERVYNYYAQKRA